MSKTYIPKDKVVIFDCVDKRHQEVWTEHRNPFNKPRPYRMMILAPPSSGKSSICKNLILRAKPEYEKVYVWGNGHSHEWQECSDEQISTDDIENNIDMFMDLDEDQKKKHRLLIIEDCELCHVNKQLKKNIALLFKHISSHYNLSIIVNVQTANMVPQEIRNNINVFAISLNIRDVQGVSTLGARIGISYADFKRMFSIVKDSVENKRYSYLVIDNTPKSPYELTVDFVNKIDLDDILGK